MDLPGDLLSSLPTCYGTNSNSESGILDKIDSIVQEEEMILLWELEELLTQELEDITEVNKDIGREELRDDFRTHVMYCAEMM